MKEEEFEIHGVISSAIRLAKAGLDYAETKNPNWIPFLKRESSYLVRRSIELWFRLRFRRKLC